MTGFNSMIADTTLEIALAAGIEQEEFGTIKPKRIISPHIDSLEFEVGLIFFNGKNRSRNTN
jgi:hypothetical protein